MTSRARFENKTTDLNNNFLCGLCLSMVALTATICLYNVCGGGERIKREMKKNHININISTRSEKSVVQ